jgi:hypothetical protein
MCNRFENTLISFLPNQLHQPLFVLCQITLAQMVSSAQNLITKLYNTNLNFRHVPLHAQINLK